ncbi:histidine phosphatase family protein [Pelomonas sp. SE-A7]|uniref:histidine phosphatase family protein n=1 Tax=Pelomonas sp. SE-A7 TaxID=3054953 RepID=UPI00259CFB5B|nr:histidine phosphatase family protein [Pelomonas sp. SE-A7]MDM4767161.1 histidine phosphatase family protein [Pelomonas sp. SE-A7]
MRIYLGALLALSLSLPAVAAPSLIVLARHAERAEDGSKDPAISAIGQARAQALAEALKHAGIDHVLTTHYRRTQQTAAPLLSARGLQPAVLTIKPGGLAEHLQEVAAAVNKLDGAVLIVGHSNTLAPLVKALGGPELRTICETSFSHLLLLTPAAEGRRLVHARYGAPDPAPEGPECQ